MCGCAQICTLEHHPHRLHKTKLSSFLDVFTVPDLYEGKDQARVVMTIQVRTLLRMCTESNYDHDKIILG